MEALIISGYAAICIVAFTTLRIPLNRWTVPAASVGGVVMVFALIQVLNFYHPHSDTSRQYLTTTSVTNEGSAGNIELPLAFEEPKLIAWFHPNSLLRLQQGSEAEVTFDSVPGKVFSGLVQATGPSFGEGHGLADETSLVVTDSEGLALIPVMIDITDTSYAWYASRLPDGSRAQAVVYGEKSQELALVRQTLLRMSAWMNYLTPMS